MLDRELVTSGLARQIFTYLILKRTRHGTRIVACIIFLSTDLRMFNMWIKRWSVWKTQCAKRPVTQDKRGESTWTWEQIRLMECVVFEDFPSHRASRAVYGSRGDPCGKKKAQYFFFFYYTRKLDLVEPRQRRHQDTWTQKGCIT